MSRAVVEIEGFSELQRKITQLANPRDKRREMLALMRNTAKSTVKAARQKARKSSKPHLISGKRTRQVIQPGNLKKSIGTITGKNKDNPTIYVGPRVKGKHLGFYGAWVEKGHNIYRKGFKRNRKGNRAFNATGASSTTTPKPFMKPAYEQTKGKVAQELEQKTAAFIQKRIDRLSR